MTTGFLLSPSDIRLGLRRSVYFSGIAADIQPKTVQRVARVMASVVNQVAET